MANVDDEIIAAHGGADVTDNCFATVHAVDAGVLDVLAVREKRRERTYLEQQAKRRGITTQELRARILTAVVKDRMIRAVLDDGL